MLIFVAGMATYAALLAGTVLPRRNGGPGLDERDRRILANWIGHSAGIFFGYMFGAGRGEG